MVIVVTTLLLVGFIAYLNRTPSYNWSEKLSSVEARPYDLSFIRKILTETPPDKTNTIIKPLSETLDELDEVNYLVMGNRMYLDTLDWKALEDFVWRGNDAFMAVNYLPPVVNNGLMKWNVEVAEGWVSDSLYTMKVVNDLGERDFHFYFKNGYGLSKHLLHYYDLTDSLGQARNSSGYFIQNSLEDGFFDNFYVVPIGDGRLFLHANPILFSNYHLTRDEGFAYANEIIGNLKNRPVVWDTYSIQFNVKTSYQDSPSSSPLRYILDQTALRYAWYTLWAGVLLFLLFRSKRRQNMVPILPKVENTSIEFARSLGALHFESRKGKPLARELMRLFDNYNRRKYGINRNKKNKDAAELIAVKSKVDIALIKEIMEKERTIVYNPTSNINDVVALYNGIKEYYKRTGK